MSWHFLASRAPYPYLDPQLLLWFPFLAPHPTQLVFVHEPLLVCFLPSLHPFFTSPSPLAPSPLCARYHFPSFFPTCAFTAPPPPSLWLSTSPVPRPTPPRGRTKKQVERWEAKTPPPRYQCRWERRGRLAQVPGQESQVIKLRGEPSHEEK